MTLHVAKTDKRYVAAAAAIGIFYAVLTFVMVMDLSPTSSDFYPHSMGIIETWFSEGFIAFFNRTPYFGFHALEAPFLYVGLDYQVASALTSSIFNAATAAVVLWFAYDLIDRSHGIWMPLIVSVALLFVTAIRFPAFSPEVYFGTGSPTIWHNPTYYAVKPFALLSMGLFLKLKTNNFESVRGCVVLSILLLVGIIMKPVFFQSFFPAVVVLYVIDALAGSRMSVRSLVVFVPSIVLGAVMVLLLFFAPSESNGEAGGIGLSFFGGWSVNSRNPWISMLLLFAFPVYAMVVNWRDFVFAKGDKQIVFLTLLVAWLENMCLKEMGARAAHGNFGWGTFLATFIAWVYALTAFANNTLRRDKPIVVLVIGWVLVAWHFVSGIYYAYHLFVSSALW